MAWGALALVLVGAALFTWWRGLGRAQREGSAVLAGLAAPVSVRFDERAVPHVSASSLLDAAAALGWLHANERFGQMEMQRRYVDGRLAEVLGSRFVALDRGMRELRLARTARAMLPALSERSRAVLEAYARGVNAWIAARGGDLPPELVALRVEPTEWTPADSLAVQMLMALRLCYSESRERLRTRWLVALGPERARQLVGVPDLPIEPELARLAVEWSARRTARDATAEKPQNGSNNWAVDASRSATGHALIANDPHLELALPSIWYQVLVRSPEYEASGFSIPGLPLVVIGQGARVAWGFTNAELDVCDVFIERVSDDGASVERDGVWVPLRSERETILVEDGEPVELELYSSDIGPFYARGEREADYAFSIAWTGYSAFDPLEPFLALAGARSVDDVPAIAARSTAPPQNLVCGDASGSILYTVLGRSVQRGFGDGRMPTPAWRSALHWRGLAPHSHTPLALRPDAALLVTANEDTRPDGFPHAYTVDAAAPERAQRIRERLAQRRDWTPEALAELQVDATSLYALEIVRATPVPAIDRPTPSDTQRLAKRAFDALRAWDGEMRERGASALYALYERQLSARLFEDELRGVGMLTHPEHKRALREALSGALDGAWFDDVRTPEREDSTTIATEALAAAWRDGAARWGDDVERWSYSEMHAWHPKHRLGDVPVLGTFFNRAARGLPGSDTSPCVFSGPLRDGVIEVGHGASLRLAADCADPDRSLAILPGGQAGQPFDEHYSDQLEPYFRGELRAMRWSEAAIEGATRQRLELLPAAR